MSNDIDFNRGYMSALTDLLLLLNTFETKLIDKSSLYHQVFEMRPKKKGSAYCGND